MAVRLSVKVSDATYETLKALAEKDETTMTDVLRRSLAVYKYLDSAGGSNGGTEIVVRDEASGKEKVLAIPA